MSTKWQELNIFFDTEFIEKPNTIQLISIGIVDKNGREFYSVSSDYNYDDANPRVQEHVIKPMYEKYLEEHSAVNFNAINKYMNPVPEEMHNFHRKIGKSNKDIAKDVLNFVGDDYPEFWAYFGAYDWVVFCWLFGPMVDLPDHFQMYCHDIKQLMDMYKLDKLPYPENEHNALADAKWTKDQFYHCLEQNYALKELL